MAQLVFGMNQSLDGYVDHMAFAPGPTLFRHFIAEAQGQAGSVYGRHMYEVMRYWDDDHPEWDTEEHAYASAWRNQPKWVVSRSLKAVSPNARLVEGDLERAIRALKAERDGEIEVAGPDLAHSLTELGLIDEYRIYLHPVVPGHGKPYFAGPRPPLRLLTHDRIGEDVIRLTYVPASSRDAPDGNRRSLSGPGLGPKRRGRPAFQYEVSWQLNLERKELVVEEAVSRKTPHDWELYTHLPARFGLVLTTHKETGLSLVAHRDQAEEVGSYLASAGAFSALRRQLMRKKSSHSSGPSVHNVNPTGCATSRN